MKMFTEDEMKENMNKEMEDLEKQLDEEYLKRDKAKKIVTDHQENINKLRKKINYKKSVQKEIDKKSDQKKAREARGVYHSKWENEKLKLDKNTKKFMKEYIFGTDSNIDISIRELHLYFEEEANKYTHINSDTRREVFVLNRRAEGMTYQAIGDIIGVSKDRVRQIISSVFKKIKHPRVGMRIMIKDNK